MEQPTSGKTPITPSEEKPASCGGFFGLIEVWEMFAPAGVVSVGFEGRLRGAPGLAAWSCDRGE
jgi:hypothetical protein